LLTGFSYVPQATSDEQQLNDLIEKIEGGLAKLDKLSRAIPMEGFTASGVALTSLRVRRCRPKAYSAGTHRA
jgi:hypothetical protein